MRATNEANVSRVPRNEILSSRHEMVDFEKCIGKVGTESKASLRFRLIHGTFVLLQPLISLLCLMLLSLVL
jgi:hypothetical protein